MSVDMTKWQEIAKANIHNRPAGTGRLAGKITVVTGAAQGFGKGEQAADTRLKTTFSPVILTPPHFVSQENCHESKNKFFRHDYQ